MSSSGQKENGDTIGIITIDDGWVTEANQYVQYGVRPNFCPVV